MAFRRRYEGPLPPDEAPTQVVHEEGGPLPPPGPPVEPDRDWWPWLLVLLVALAIIAGVAAYFATRGGGEANVIVPKVVGMQEPAAKAKLADLKLESRSTQEFSSKPTGIVVSQAPGEGTQAGPGDLVELTVSKGSQAVAAPNVVSLTEADAVAQLTTAGLKADVVQVPSSAKAGTVVAQNPASGKSVDPGSTVRLNVSKGRTQTTTVTTTTQTTATATTTHTTTQTTTTASTTTQPTTTPVQSTLPDVVGSTLSSAVGQMRSASLLADSYPVSSDQPGGTVVAQTPDSGTSVDAGSIVRLNVSTGTERPNLPVPDVTGATQAAARRTLSRLFTVRTVFRNGEQPGVVVGQLPQAGAEAKRWAQVVIYVGR